MQIIKWPSRIEILDVRKSCFGGSQNILIHKNWIIRGNFCKTQNRALYIVLFADSCCTSAEVIQTLNLAAKLVAAAFLCWSLKPLKVVGHNLQGCNVGVTVSS